MVSSKIKEIRVNPDKLRLDILRDISNNSSYFLETSKQIIKNMTPEEAFNCYCNWHGLVDWSKTLIDALDNIRRAAEEIPLDSGEPQLSLSVHECKSLLGGKTPETARINKKLLEFVKENS